MEQAESGGVRAERNEWERMLHDPSEVSRLVDWSRNVSVDDMAVAHTSNGFAAEAPVHFERPSATIVAVCCGSIWKAAL